MISDCQTDMLTFDQRMNETAEILAAGILRSRKQSSHSFSASGLDFKGKKSVHSAAARTLPKGENE
jgi:hypothetical protein